MLMKIQSGAQHSSEIFYTVGTQKWNIPDVIVAIDNTGDFLIESFIQSKLQQ
jgi:hypothetical protein